MRLWTAMALALLAITTGCRLTPSAEEPAWRWSDERILETVGHVRAGRDLTPPAWPGGARVAVLLSFDVDTETIPLAYGEHTISELSRGEYGARAGLDRVLATLDRHDVPATFFVPAVSLMLHPEMTEKIQRSGRHELGVHGWIHEPNTALSREEERALLVRATEQLERVAGERPVGYRAPSWNFSAHTLDLVRELGFLYDSSLMADDRPYEILAGGAPTGIVELPVSWILDDWPLLDPLEDRWGSPAQVLQVYVDEFDRAHAEGTMFVLTLHPQIIGHRSRIGILEQLIDHVREREEVWFGTHRAAAEYVRARSGLSATQAE